MNEPQQPDASEFDCIEARGPWPFITHRVFQSDQTKTFWNSRHHRKGLGQGDLREFEQVSLKVLSSLWMPRQLNWWIGTIFALGSFLFSLASLLSLSPVLAGAWSLDANQINAIFFAGSVPFTIAAYLQLFQAANAGEIPGHDPAVERRPVLFGWRPGDIGWLSCALQFVGTILFNFNTFDAMIPSLNWFQQDMVIWMPNIIGSILFLASGYLGFIETCHAHWAWKPSSLSWWVVFINLLGCIGFMGSALFAIVLPGTTNGAAVTIAVAFTLAGAICFFAGSLLMLPETKLSVQPQE